MSDLNFFYELNLERRNKTRIITLLLCIIIVVLGSTVSSLFYLDRYIYREKVDIENQNKQLSSNNRIKEEHNFQRISEEEKRLKESLEQIQKIKAYVSDLNKVTTQGILRIFNTLPENVSISSFEWTKGVLSMECESVDRRGVSSTINNLKEMGVKEINIPSIVAVENEEVTIYRFHISGKINGGENNEDE